MASIGDLVAHVLLDSSSWDAGIAKMRGKLEELDKEGEKSKGWTSGLDRIGEAMQGAGLALTGLSATVGLVGGAALKMSGDFESALNKITAVGGQTGAELAVLREQAMQLGKDTKYSAQEAAEGMGNLAAAGLNTSQVMQSMPGVLDLAAAGELSVARAAEVTTDTLGQFSLAASDAGRVADVMAAGAAASSINVEQLAQAMKMAGPPAKSAGMSIEQTAAAIALLGNAGIKGEMAGTAMRGILASLISPSKEAAKAIAALGVETKDAAGQMLPLDQIFTQLKEKGAGTAEMFAIFGREAASAAIALKDKTGPAWAEMTKQIDNSEGAAKRMAETLNKGLKGGFEQLKGSIDTALISLGESLQPALETAISLGTKVVNDFLLPAVKWFGDLPQPIKNAAIAFVALSAAVGPILLGLGTMLVMFAQIAPGLALLAKGLGLTTAGMFGWAGAIVVAVAALVGLGTWIYQNWDAIAVGFISKFIKMEETVRSFYSAIGYTKGVEAIDKELARLNKTMDDHAWKVIEAKDKAREMKEEQERLAKALKEAKEKGDAAAVTITGLAGALGTGTPATVKHTKATTEAATSFVKLADATKQFVPSGKAFSQVLDDLHKKTLPAGEALWKMGEEAKKNEKKLMDMHMPTAELGAYMEKTFGPAAKQSAAALETVGAKATAAKPEVVKLGEALNSLGVTSAAQFTKIADDAKKAYDAVVASGSATQWEKDSALIALLEAEQDAMRAHGMLIPEYHQQMLDKLKRQTEQSGKEQKKVWEELFRNIGDRLLSFKDDVLASLFERMFGDPNKELKQQEADLVKSLGTRAGEWDAYVADNAKQLSDLTANYEAALDEQERATADALADAAADYAEFAAEVAENIEDIKTKHATAADEEVADAQDALARKTADYEEYTREVAEQIEEAHEKYRAQLEEENETLADALADRATQYSDFVRDTNTKLSRLGQDTATNIEDETEDTQRNIDERRRDYLRYADDTARKIAEVRNKNKGVYSNEERDLEISLKRKQEDLDAYVAEQNERLERYIRDQKLREERETADAKQGLADRTRDYNDWVAETLEKHDEKVAAIKAAEDSEVTKQKEALDKKTADYTQYVADTELRIEEIRAKHAAAQDSEVAKQLEALGKKKGQYDQHVADILAKNDEAVAGINADYQQSTADLARELDNEKAAYAAFVADITGPGGKLDQLKEQHRTVWSDIAGFATAAMQDIGNAILRVASDEIIGVLLGKTKSLSDLFSGIGKGLDKVLGGGDDKTPSVPSVPGGGGGGIPGAGSAGSAGGGLSGFLGSQLFGNILSAGTMISSIIGNFQSAKQETTLNAIEESTRFTALYVGHRADGGMLQRLFDINDAVRFGPLVVAVEDFRNKFYDWTGVINPMVEQIRNTLWESLPLQATLLENVNTSTQRVAQSVERLADRPITVNVSPQGLTTAEAARALGDQIARNMRTQFAGAL